MALTGHHALRAVLGDLAASDGERVVQGVLEVPQLTAPASVQALPLLPSFLYLPHDSEMEHGQARDLPAKRHEGVVGELAGAPARAAPRQCVGGQRQELAVPPGVDRRAPLLPADAPPEVERISPLTASTRYLEHLRWAWGRAHPRHRWRSGESQSPFRHRSIRQARELTATACRRAGWRISAC